jgi:hypothetical protein
VKASLFYRIAAVLLLLFAVGHTLGFRQSDPTWGVDALLGSMRSIHFDVQGFSRTYWDLFVAAGFSVGVFYLFAAVLAWQLGGLLAETLAVMRVTVWALALCFAAITVVSWRYLFILPIVFSIVITVCLTAAAWLSCPQHLSCDCCAAGFQKAPPVPGRGYQRIHSEKLLSHMPIDFNIVVYG